MILVRDIFHLKFGKSREALDLWREGKSILHNVGSGPMRVLVDVTGRYYTLVLESTHTSLSSFEKEMQDEMGDEAWKKWYQKFVLLVESGSREIFRIID